MYFDVSLSYITKLINRIFINVLMSSTSQIVTCLYCCS